MKGLLNRLTSFWRIAAILLGYVAFGFYLKAQSAGGTGQTKYWIAGALLLGLAVGMAMRWRWARVACIGLLLCLVALKAYALVFRAFSVKQLFYAVSSLLFARALWKNPDEGLFEIPAAPSDKSPEDTEKSGDEEPIISLVHLRSQPRYLEPVVLAGALSEAWGLNIFGGEGEPPDDADGFVAGRDSLYLVLLQKPVTAMFMVHNRGESYFNDAEKLADGVANLRFAEIIREHSAWLAVDLMEAPSTGVKQEEAYRLIGKAISALADEEVMAIFCPQHEFFNLWSPELEKILCGDSPLDALRQEVKAPVYGVPSGEMIEQAIAEARRRWPEFVAAFKKRKPADPPYIVKAPLTGENGEVEHIWLEVFGLEPEYVHGHLINEPIHSTELKKGSQVEVPVATISDWLCPDGEGNPLGNFTHNVVMRAAKERQQAAQAAEESA